MAYFLPSLRLPYPWIMPNCVTTMGQRMYPRETVECLARLVRAGLLRLDDCQIDTFPLDEANEAVASAAANAGPFRMTVIRP